MAKAACFATALTVNTSQELSAAIDAIYETNGAVFVAVKVDAARYPMQLRLRDGTHIKNRFREAVLGSKAFD
jgi:thiamine pyrophosphate-dependent acetolactate synthase large subunit-like protein